MKTTAFLLTVLVGGAAGVAFASGAKTEGPDSRVTVTYVDPEKFTDFSRNDWEHTSPDLQAELKKFLVATGERYVPAGMHLDIKVTDIDLAGAFEPWRGPQFDHVRVVKAIYPPRIALQFKLTNAQGKTVSAGDRALTDLTFQDRDAFLLPADDYLRYEKSLLTDWFSSEFKSVKVAGD